MRVDLSTLIQHRYGQATDEALTAVIDRLQFNVRSAERTCCDLDAYTVDFVAQVLRWRIADRLARLVVAIEDRRCRRLISADMLCAGTTRDIVHQQLRRMEAVVVVCNSLHRTCALHSGQSHPTVSSFAEELATLSASQSAVGARVPPYDSKLHCSNSAALDMDRAITPAPGGRW